MANGDSITDYYVYVHKRADDGSVFYVGKGTRTRAWQLASKRNTHWQRIVAKHGLIVEIVESGYQNWYAMEREIQLIEFYGQENLCNQTAGGEGGNGRVWTEESKKRLSDAKKGKPAPWSTGDKNHMKTQASREKMSRLLKGVSRPYMAGKNNPMHKQENKDAVTARCKGKKRPEITGVNHKLAKKVFCVETGAVFDCGEDAAKWLRSQGFSMARQSNISSVCTGNLKSAYGFHWKHA